MLSSDRCALLICRFSNIRLRGHPQRAHKGESLFKEARKYLKDEFDQPSIATIQGFVLMATYHLTFGVLEKHGYFSVCGPIPTIVMTHAT